MKNVQMKNVEEIKKFLEGNDTVEFEVGGRKEKYEFVSKTLMHLKYKALQKKTGVWSKSFSRESPDTQRNS